jgi:hypothetical protein
MAEHQAFFRMNEYRLDGTRELATMVLMGVGMQKKWPQKTRKDTKK